MLRIFKFLAFWVLVVGGLYPVDVVFAGDSGLACIGNSMTFHGRATSIGWDGAWGMAASQEGRDYCSLLASRLKADGYVSRGDAQRINVSWLERNEAGWDVKTKNALSSVSADYLVVFIGDNVPKADSKGAEFSVRLRSLLGMTKNSYRKGVVVVGTWWPRPELDAVLRAEAATAGAGFVSLQTFWKRDELKAGKERSITNAGVGAHPGDLGMSEIARVISVQIKSGGRK